MGSWFGMMFGLAWLSIRVHRQEFPGEPVAQGVWFGVMLFAVLFGTVPLSLLFANLLAYVVPPARKALNAEAAQTGTAGFLESQRGMLKAALLFSLPTLLLALFATYRSWG